MSTNDTTRLGLPLLQPAQAQKHVTVNEALQRLDGLVNLVLQSVSQTAPPSTLVEGECWGVPSGAMGDWSGHDGAIAIASNGGWAFAHADAGMSAFVIDRGASSIHDGRRWLAGMLSLGQTGSGLASDMIEGEVTVSAGTSFATGIIIPDGVMVIGAVARVTSAITGSLSSWRLGHAGAQDRFGSGLGLSAGSWARGLLGSPTSYYSPQELILTAEGGAFSGGQAKLAVHWLEMRLPEM